MTIKAIFLFKSSYGNEYIATNNSYESPKCVESHGQETCTNCGYAWALCDEVEDAYIWLCEDMEQFLICKSMVEMSLECDILDIELVMENDCVCVGKCGMSTGICGSLTFGHGNLDYYGYWEFGCTHCARAWELAHPKDGPCWPFSQEYVDSLEV